MERYKQPFVAGGSAPVIWQRGRKYVFSVMGVPNNKREQGAVHLAKRLGVDTDGSNGWSVRLNTNKEADPRDQRQ